MDITFSADGLRFNDRAAAILVCEGRLLVLRDDSCAYTYLPGGRVHAGETAEAAVLRELREELGIEARIERPLWVNQAFFTEDVDGLRYHELCLYFLMDISDTNLTQRGPVFTLTEGTHTHTFEWLAFDRLKDAYFYPIFLKKEIYNLPNALTVRAEFE